MFDTLARVRGSYEPKTHHHYEKPPRNYRKLPKEEIIKNIKALHNNCGKYQVSSNNCEHLATFVRYNKGIVVQVRLFEHLLLDMNTVNYLTVQSSTLTSFEAVQSEIAYKL